jgi:hypothetical protein
MKLGDDGSNILRDKTIQVPTWWKDAQQPGVTVQANG